MLRTILPAIMCSLLVSSYAAAESPKKVDVPAGDLAAALQQLAKQADAEFVFSPNELKGVRTEALHGEFTAESAVIKLLEGTKFRLVKHSSGAFLIAPQDGSASTSASTDLLHVRGESGATQWGMRVAQEDPTSAREGRGTNEEGFQSSDKKGEPQGEKLEEIIVTAQKREERLQDVPISISVMSGEKLDRSTAQGLTEILNTVPGVAAFQYTQQTGGSNVAIRGVSAGNPVNNGSSPISYYLDSVPFGFVRTAIGPETNAFDLDRVEVLRGPQGTLYGASALNGVVRVLSRDADLNKFEFKSRTAVSSTEGGGANYRADAAINFPFIEGKLGARAVASYQDLSGWISRPTNNNANDAKLKTVRVKLNARPGERLSLGASLWSSQQDYGSPSFSDDNQRTARLHDEPIATDYDVLGAKIGYEFPSVSLTATSGHLTYESRSIIDFSDNTGGSLAPYSYNVKSEVLSQEINLNSTTGGPWRWTAGGIYRDDQDDTSAIIPAASVRLISELGSESYAFFGEATRLLADGQFELTAGVRYFHDDVYFQNAVSSQRLDSSFSSTTPRAVATWHPSENYTVYASYAEGFRSGAPQSLGAIPPEFPAVKPDKLKNHEIGAKGSMLDGRVSFDMALYYMKWDDVQLTLTVPYQSVTVNALVNASSVSGPGTDIGFSFRPADGLTLGVNFGWNDLTLDENVISLCGAVTCPAAPSTPVVLFASGDRLNFSPELTASGSLDYAFSLGEPGYEGQFSTSVNYTSEQDHRTIVRGAMFKVSGDPLLVGRASFSVHAPSNWSISLFADNFTNEGGSIYGQPFSGVVRPHLDGRLRPRTVGLQFEYAY